MSEIGLQPMNAGGPMTESDWTDRNPLLDRFQIGLVVDAATGMITKAKLGDGTHHWNDLEWWSPDGGLTNTDAINALTPMPANSTTEFAGKNTIAAVGRIVLGQTTDAGQGSKYVRIRASAGGAILAEATTGNGATSLTVINRGEDAETYAIEIEAWLELVVTAATVSMLSSATIGDIGATNTANVFARFATPTSAAEAATQRAYVFETDDPSLTFYEATPQTVYGAGTASCNGEVTFYDVSGGMPAFVFAGSTSTTDDGIRGDGTSYAISRGTEQKYTITTTAASPSLATGTWTVTNGTAPAPTVLGVTYDVEVASRVQIGQGIMAVGTAVVQTNVGTKQALLPAVPVGFKRIVLPPIARNASASLATLVGEDILVFGGNGFDGGYTSGDRLQFVTLPEDAVYCTTYGAGLVKSYDAGTVFGCVFNDTSVTANLTIDTWYYDVPA